MHTFSVSLRLHSACVCLYGFCIQYLCAYIQIKCDGTCVSVLHACVRVHALAYMYIRALVSTWVHLRLAAHLIKSVNASGRKFRPACRRVFCSGCTIGI